MSNSKGAPSADEWLREAKADPSAAECGMYLIHNGTVRQSARARVRQGQEDAAAVEGMNFDFDPVKVEQAVERARQLPGIYYVRAWLNRGRLELGDDIMMVLIGGDIRPRVVDALQQLVGELKEHCVSEVEVFRQE